MIVVVELIGVCVFTGIMFYGITKAFAWWDKANKRVAEIELENQRKEDDNVS